MVITEMDKGEEKLLAVAWTYLYSVGIQIVDSAKHLRDKLGYLGNSPFSSVTACLFW